MQIFKGWFNFLTGLDGLAKEKAKHCNECPNKKHGKLLEFIKDDLKEVEGFYCDICKCPLSAKLRSDDKCPLNHF